MMTQAASSVHSGEVSVMRFDDLPMMLMSLQSTYTLGLIVVFCCVIAGSIRMRRGWVSYITTSVLIILSVFLYEIFIMFMDVKPTTLQDIKQAEQLRTVPEWVWLTVLAVLTALAVLMSRDVLRYASAKLSSHSVKFAIDDMQAGICIYDQNGRILLMNKTLADISIELTGKYVLSGTYLWDNIQENTPMICRNGEVYTLRKDRISAAGIELDAITAENITAEYSLTEQLRETNNELREQEKKLKKLNDLITEMTIQKEILAAKTRIHDRFGSTIIATKRYIQGVSENSKDQIKEMWHKDTKLLRSASEPEQTDPYENVFTVAGFVGVSIATDGILPVETAVSEVLVIAMIECITNTFRHAKGDLLRVKCEDNEDGYVFTLTNNGNPPESDVSETGGLKNLRQSVVNAGGTMEIKSRPEFRLTIKMPKGDTGYGI
ncbi:MAG: hypothetical protein ILP19_04345 [Oscillospiraceae bacterium]|nr:hypothetical protein [Oscillospiraceae bacterium]